MELLNVQSIKEDHRLFFSTLFINELDAYSLVRLKDFLNLIIDDILLASFEMNDKVSKAHILYDPFP